MFVGEIIKEKYSERCMQLESIFLKFHLNKSTATSDIECFKHGLFEYTYTIEQLTEKRAEFLLHQPELLLDIETIANESLRNAQELIDVYEKIYAENKDFTLTGLKLAMIYVNGIRIKSKGSTTIIGLDFDKASVILQNLSTNKFCSEAIKRLNVLHSIDANEYSCSTAGEANVSKSQDEEDEYPIRPYWN